MFVSYVAFGIELFCFAVGAGFLIWAFRNDGVGVVFAKVVGFFVMIVAVLAMMCTFMSSMKMKHYSKFYSGGYHSTPMHPYMYKRYKCGVKPFLYKSSQVKPITRQ